jgi:hypothetical protein
MQIQKILAEEDPAYPNVHLHGQQGMTCAGLFAQKIHDLEMRP